MKDLTQLQRNLDRLNGLANSVLSPSFVEISGTKCPKCYKEVSGEEKNFVRFSHVCVDCERSN
jgi:hypothetical protein